MINVDDRLLSQLDEKEMWLLMHIVKRLGADGTCWPSNETLMTDTGWKDVRTLRRVKKQLEDKGIMKQDARFNDKNEQRSNTYTVLTDLIGVYKSANKLQTGGAKNAPATGVQKMHLPGVHEMQGAGVHQMHHEVLSNEVLSNEVKGTPFGFFDPLIKNKIGEKHYQLLCGAAIECKDRSIRNFLLDSDNAEILFDWLEYKKEKRQTYKTEKSMSALIEKKFMPFTSDELRQAYQDSVTANWAGIFPKKQNKKNAKDEPRFGAATHSEIERALEIRRARRQAV